MAIEIVDTEEYTKRYELSFFKCPFRKYKDEDFKPCYEHNCMAFRCHDDVFWCALIEAYRKTPDSSKHPIEMLKGDDDW